MVQHENPFTPSFGEIPAHLAGRKQVVSNLVLAYESERRRPELTTLLSGARGTGKTTLLSLLAEKAEARGWISASTTARPGMLDDIEINLKRNAKHLIEAEKKESISGIQVAPIGGITFEKGEEPLSNWRSRMTDVLEQLKQHNIGVLITVDEIDPSLNEMVELSAVYQHFVREGYKVALLMAGLPHNVSALLNDKTVSFLRRAQIVKLGRIADYDVEDALVKTIDENGRRIDAEAVHLAVEAIDGFPFLLQLVGFRAWDAHPAEQEISSDDVRYGIRIAQDEMEDRIFEATYRELSPEDIRFVCAMLEDEGDSKVSDLSTRLERSPAQVGQYRRRLIEAGVIGERGRGVVGFELPHFREYLAERQGL